MLDESKRRRAMRPEVKVSRQALAVVRQLGGRIGGWQADSARLTALGRHLLSRGGDTSEVLAEAERLVAVVSGERRALAERRDDLPPAVAASSRISDTDRALQGILQGLEALIGLLRPVDSTPPGATNASR